jgi:hypothetical protein
MTIYYKCKASNFTYYSIIYFNNAHLFVLALHLKVHIDLYLTLVVTIILPYGVTEYYYKNVLGLHKIHRWAPD